MDLKRCSVLIWAIGGVGIALGLFGASALKSVAPVPLAKQTAGWCLGGFVPGGAYPTTSSDSLPSGVATVGSWNDGDAWQGEAETVWLPAPRTSFCIWVAGYPHHVGCRLAVEFRRHDGSVVGAECSISNPAETWGRWDISPPEGAERMRIVAADRASDGGGWFAFSEPTTAPSDNFRVALMAVQVFAAFALTLALVWGPGMLWAPARLSEPLRMVWLLAAGPLTLVLLAILIWVFGGFIAPRVLGLALVGMTWIALGITLWRGNPTTQLSKTRVQALAVTSLCALAAVARAANSNGPDGELYGGLIARSLAVGDRSDSRITYFIPQIIDRHLSPASAEAERYFTPWTFFSRGPLAGGAATPIVFATGGVPVAADSNPGNATSFYRWQRFDRYGFAAYRIVLITLASLVIFGLFAVLVGFVGETWALIGCGLLALCPFGVHEVMFTWPKFEATACVLASFLLCQQRMPLGAGLALAIGFLFHPLAALWAPWLALWCGGSANRASGSFLTAGFRFSVGFCLLALPWIALGQLTPHLPNSLNAGQGGFIEYFRLAGYAPATWASWWSSRATNFANTFLPFWLHLFHENNSAIGSVYGPAGRVVKFAFGWWNTLPLGLGLLLWLISMITLCRTARRLGAAIGLFVVGPALLLTAYWGAYVTGLMRECGQPLLAAVIGVMCVGLARFPGRLSSLVANPIFPWVQLPETFLMLWLTTYLNPYQPGVDGRALNLFFAAINVLALGTTAFLLCRARLKIAATASTFAC